MSAKRPHMRGVSVRTHRGRHGTRYYGRYTMRDGSRPSVEASETWDEAFEKAVAEQRRTNRSGYRDTRSGRMTFKQLVAEQWLPTQVERGLNTQSNHDSHLGNVEGKPARKGGKAERAAKFALLAWFGRIRIMDITPQDVRQWQAGMLEAGYLRGSIKAKRSLLKCILDLAVKEGWIDLNPVLAVKEPGKEPVKDDDDRTFTPTEWALVRLRMAGEATLLLVDLLLDLGLRFGEATALRPKDLLDADGTLACRVRICRNVIWPGRKYTETDKAWVINDFTKGKRDRTLAISVFLYRRLLAYIERCGLAEDALIFDIARLRAEHAERREHDPLPRTPHGRYVNAKSGRSGPHGDANTYKLGCRCIHCRNAESEYMFWRRRSLGRRTVQPWRDPEFLAARADAVDPVSNQWFNTTVWEPAVVEVLPDWKPTPHQLRHAMVTWCMHNGVSPRVTQLDAGHASLSTTEGYAHRLDKLDVPTDRLRAMEAMYARMDAPPDGFVAASAQGGDDLEAMVRAWLAAQDPSKVAEVMVGALRGETLLAGITAGGARRVPQIVGDKSG